MTDEWANALGLATTSLFGRDPGVPDGQHYLLLDGVHGSFGLSRVHNDDFNADTRSWAWSSGVLHHVTATNDNVIVRRWDNSDTDRYSTRSVFERLDRFYNHLSKEQSNVNRTISVHAIDAFRRLRSLFNAEEQGQALSVFLLLLGAMLLDSADEAVTDRAPEVVRRFGLSPTALEGLRRVSPEMIRLLISGFRRPKLPQVMRLETIPSLVVRHAGAMLFQEAHFELARQGATDLFGIPEAASTKRDVVGGIHFTPPGLARALGEQALHAYGELSEELTILDPACGSGSILYEAVRSLKDLGYKGRLQIIGFDTSSYAVEMTRFLLSSARNDCPNFCLHIEVERRNSLDERDWPYADIILMNPPFVSLRSLSKEQKLSISRILGDHSKGRPDLSMAFIERGTRTVRRGGVVATLLPAGVLSMTHAQGWRRHLLDEASVSLIATFSELGLFKMATVETGILVLNKSANADGFYKSMWVGEKRDSTSEALRFLRKAGQDYYGGTDSDRWSLDEVPSAKLQDTPSWRPRPRLIQRQLEAISNFTGSTVGDFFRVKQGALPAPRDAFVVDADDWERLPKDERRWFRRVAENGNIRFGQILPGKFIFFPKGEGLPSVENEESLREQVPEFFKRLFRFKHQLVARRGKQERWWELGEDRQWLRASSKKIVSAYFGQVGSFAFDLEGDHVIVQGYGWVPTWVHTQEEAASADLVFDAYVALFNSLAFFQVLAEFCPPVGGGQLNLSKRFTEKAPLPDLVGRAFGPDQPDPILRDLAFIGQIIRSRGLAVAPRSKAEELAKILFGFN